MLRGRTTLSMATLSSDRTRYNWWRHPDRCEAHFHSEPICSYSFSSYGCAHYVFHRLTQVHLFIILCVYLLCPSLVHLQEFFDRLSEILTSFPIFSSLFIVTLIYEYSSDLTISDLPPFSKTSTLFDAPL